VLNRDHCIHYNGVHRDACAAGVGYATVAREQTPGEQERARAAGAIDLARFGLIHRLPCIRGNGVDTCPLQQFPTAEQHAAALDAAEQLMGRTGRVLAAITADGRPSGEISPCPACETGTLRFTRAGTLAIRVACTTNGCVRLIG
jgi:hypothetical protein